MSLPVSTGNMAAEGLLVFLTLTPVQVFLRVLHCSNTDHTTLVHSASSQTFTLKLQQEGTHPGPPQYLCPPGPPLRSRWECFQVEVQEGGSPRLSELCRKSQKWTGLRWWGEELQKSPTEETVFQTAVMVTLFLRFCFLTASGGKMASLASSSW